MKKIVFTLFLVIILGIGWYLVSPLLITKTVDEAFPGIHIPTEAEVLAMPVEERERVEKELIEAFAKQPDIVMEDPMLSVLATPEVSTQPVLVSSGSFVGTDSFHTGSGSVGLYTLPDDSRVLRFEDFSVVNGPDLRVLLTRHPNPQTRDDVDEGYIELGKLKGNKGNQNYEVSDAIDLSLYTGVVIYCKPFHVVFAKASLE